MSRTAKSERIFYSPRLLPDSMTAVTNKRLNASPRGQRDRESCRGRPRKSSSPKKRNRNKESHDSASLGSRSALKPSLSSEMPSRKTNLRGIMCTGSRSRPRPTVSGYSDQFEIRCLITQRAKDDESSKRLLGVVITGISELRPAPRYRTEIASTSPISIRYPCI